MTPDPDLLTATVATPAPETAASGNWREFFTGQFIKTDLLVSWLEQHGIIASTEFVDASGPDDGDLAREVRILVTEADYPRAHQLFFTEREDEL